MERKILISEYSNDTFRAIVDRGDNQAQIRYCVEPSNQILVSTADLKLFAGFVSELAEEVGAHD